MAALPLSRSTASAVLSMLFQPIVDLRTEEVIGYEALARGPLGSPWEAPQELFAQARVEGRLREMDWACRIAAVRDVRACSPERPTWRLFVNTEPEVLGSTCPQDLVADWIEGTGDLEIVVEVTERALVQGPRRLIEAIDELRDLGCEIALDDVGSNPASVALLPLIEPDVVKLDAALLRPSADELPLSSLRAVASYVERSGATVVAEGIEDVIDLANAHALGAQWGQGYYFARPRPLSSDDLAVSRVPATAGERRRRAVAGGAPAQDDVPSLLVDAAWVSEHLRGVAEAARAGASMNVLLMRLPDFALAPAGFVQLIEELHATCALSVVVLAQGPLASAPPGLARLAPEDVTAVLLGPSVAHSMVARRTASGRYRVTTSARGDTVAAAARAFVAQSL